MVGGGKRRVFCICVCLLHRSCQVATGELGSPTPDPHAFFLSRETLLASIAIALKLGRVATDISAEWAKPRSARPP